MSLEFIVPTAIVAQGAQGSANRKTEKRTGTDRLMCYQPSLAAPGSIMPFTIYSVFLLPEVPPRLGTFSVTFSVTHFSNTQELLIWLMSLMTSILDKCAKELLEAPCKIESDPSTTLHSQCQKGLEGRCFFVWEILEICKQEPES